MSVLGIDVGTSTCKGVVISGDGTVIAQHSIEYAHSIAFNGPLVEIPAEIFWESTVTVIRELAKRTHDLDPIEALAISTHGETLIPTDENGCPVCNAILSMDRRGVKEALELEQMLDADFIYHTTGSMMHSQYPAAKIRWILHNRPEMAKRIKHYYSTSDYINSKLGFYGIVDYSIASRFGIFDIHRRRWSSDILNALEIKEDMLSHPVQAGTLLGVLPKETADSLGLGNNVRVFAGGHDQPCAAVGMGVMDKGLTVSAGSYECASIMTDVPLNDSRGKMYGLNSYCHVLPQKYITLAFFTSGLVVQWFLNTFCEYEQRISKENGTNIYDEFDSLVGDDPTGICMTPHIYGAMNPEWSETATATITGITASATKATFYRAMLEGLCCELDLNIRVLESLTQSFDRFVMSGGGTRSTRWMQLRADITGKSIDVVSEQVEASCLGAAILAGVGAGIFRNWKDASAKAIQYTRHFEPRDSARFNAQKEKYRTLHGEWLLV